MHSYIIYIALHTAVVVVLIYQYFTTHERTLLWFGGLFLAWRLFFAPLLAYGIKLAVDILASGEVFFPLSLLRQWGISTRAIIIAFVYLPNLIELFLAITILVVLVRDKPDSL